jgi:3-methyladenine DNA glycosylase AlkD
MGKTPEYIARHLRAVLRNGASAPHTAEVENFFQHEITSRGWYTHEVRRLARRFTKVLKNEAGLDFLVAVADQLYRGDVLEEKVLAVFLLESSVKEFQTAQFKLLEQWLERASTWADHDALVYYLIGPMVAALPGRASHALRWTRSKRVWHRRAAAVALIRGARVGMFDREIREVTGQLLQDKEDIVRKGLGWLLREYAKFNREKAMPLLRSISGDAPRLVLRTACETLPPELRQSLLKSKHGRPQKAGHRPGCPEIAGSPVQ